MFKVVGIAGSIGLFVAILFWLVMNMGNFAIFSVNFLATHDPLHEVFAKNGYYGATGATAADRETIVTFFWMIAAFLAVLIAYVWPKKKRKF